MNCPQLLTARQASGRLDRKYTIWPSNSETSSEPQKMMITHTHTHKTTEEEKLDKGKKMKAFKVVLQKKRENVLGGWGIEGRKAL